MAGISEPRIAIIGAGPAGTTAAISLAKKGIPSLLIDKAHFPRKKICGDGLSGKVISNLNRLDPGLAAELFASGLATPSNAVLFISPNGHRMELPFKPDKADLPPGFICKREDFDNFLLNKALQYKEIHFLPETQVIKFEPGADAVTLISKDGNIIAQTRLLLYAGGFNHKLMHMLDPSCATNIYSTGIGVRGYFENVAGSDEKHAIEIQFLEELLPWYLWIFPFSDGSANVGIALPPYIEVSLDVSLKKVMLELIDFYPHLKKRFKHARLKGKIEAARLPYYTGPKNIAGNNYMFLGDAASLIDPFTGEGIGNAMASGRYAAEAASHCLENNDFSVTMTMSYQQLVDTKLAPELKLGLKLQHLARHKSLLNLVIGKASKNNKLRAHISDMLYNEETKENLKKPGFYIKLLLGR